MKEIPKIDTLLKEAQEKIERSQSTLMGAEVNAEEAYKTVNLTLNKFALRAAQVKNTLNSVVFFLII